MSDESFEPHELFIPTNLIKLQEGSNKDNHLIPFIEIHAGLTNLQNKNTKLSSFIWFKLSKSFCIFLSYFLPSDNLKWS